MRKIIFLILLTACFYSCNSREENTQSRNKNSNLSETNTYEVYSEEFFNVVKMDSLKNKVRKEGDILAFQELKEIYYNSGHENEFLYYSTFMANVYNYDYAFYTSYSILMTDIINEKNKINNIYANYYLLKSYELGYKEAYSTIEERFGKSERFISSKDYLNDNYDLLFGK